MEARLTTKPEQDVIAAIHALDLESVKLRVMDPELGEGWGREYADSIEVAYKNYLTMLVKYQDHAEDILLSKDVDEFWHTHILQTIKYTDDCEKTFGSFLHHSPHVGERSPADLEKRVALAEKTRQLYQQEFRSVQNAEAAWAGDTNKMENVAWSTASIKAEKAAWSTVSIKPENSAWSTVSIKPENSAWSTASIKAENAAWSTASIKAENAAWSTASIRAENTAFQNAKIVTKKAEYSVAA
jgi:hypothetical protein